MSRRYQLKFIYLQKCHFLQRPIYLAWECQAAVLSNVPTMSHVTSLKSSTSLWTSLLRSLRWRFSDSIWRSWVRNWESTFDTCWVLLDVNVDTDDVALIFWCVIATLLLIPPNPTWADQPRENDQTKKRKKKTPARMQAPVGGCCCENPTKFRDTGYYMSGGLYNQQSSLLAPVLGQTVVPIGKATLQTLQILLGNVNKKRFQNKFDATWT